MFSSLEGYVDLDDLVEADESCADLAAQDAADAVPAVAAVNDSSTDDTPEEVVCSAMTAVGIPDARPGDARLRALLRAGADLDEFVNAAYRALEQGKGFPYAVGIVAGERRRAAELAGQLHAGALPTQAKAARPTFAQAQSDLVRSTVPGRAGKDPALKRIEADAAWDDDYLNDYAAGAKRRKLDGVELRIYFVDRNGVATERNISTLNYAHDPATHGGSVYAFCHLRQANRPFAFSRIKRAVDLRTGEVVVDLGAYLDSIYFLTPAGVVDKFLDEHSAGMFVLFSFAKADGAMRVKERAIMLDWARSQGLTDEAALTSLEEQMKKVWYTTDHAFWDAVKTVKKEGRDADYMQSIWSAVQAILNSDKKLGDQEEQYLKYAARQWGLDVPELTALPQIKLKA